MAPDRLSFFITVPVLLTIASCSGAVIISEPTSQITFEDRVSVFSCHSNGTLFWQINGELFDHTKLEYLQGLGFDFSDTYSEESVTRNISVVGSRETNNTVFTCVSVDSENEVTFSRNATLTVIGSPSNVTRTFVNASVFKLTWEGSLTPVTLQPHNYTVNVQYKDSPSQVQTKTFVVPVSNETNMYAFEYPVPESLLPLSTCSQFIFSVLSTNVMGDSEPVKVSWEKPQEPADRFEDMECILKVNNDDSMTALVQFKFPELCHFQKVNYSFSLSPADTNSHPIKSSNSRIYIGGGERAIQGQLRDLKLDLEEFYRVKVSAELLENEERIDGPTTICSEPGFKPPSTGSLGNPTDQSTPEVIAGIVISALLLVAILLLNGTMLVIVLYQRKKKNKV